MLLLVLTLASAATGPSLRAAEPGPPWQLLGHHEAGAKLWFWPVASSAAEPTVLLVPGCSEQDATSRGRNHWAAHLRGERYHVGYLQLTSAQLRCPPETRLDELVPRTTVLAAVMDWAATQLRARGDVRYDRVAAMGWSRRGTLSAMSMRNELPWSRRFRAGVSFYPDCRYPVDARFATPTLILAGLKDGKLDESHCALMMRRMYHGRAAAEQRVYPNADLRFDERLETTDHLQAMLNLEALRAARRDAMLFLREHLRPEHVSAAADDVIADVWTVNPQARSPDLPPQGRSLLDELLRGGEDIPYPFEALVDRLAQHAGPGYFGRDAVKHVFVPLGRSLQRNANHPDFFGSPRVVLAVDTEPDDSAQTVNLKDRLFLGYQLRAGVIEAISWNPLAGRFEFQVIRDYRDGASPTLAYANRQVCSGCHQNGGPIFSRAPWTETNANPRIREHINAKVRSFHGLDTARLGDTAEHIDAATDRASFLLTAQHIWREGCGSNDAAGFQCRAALATAVLQYRLSGEAMFAEQSASFRTALARLQDTWRSRWPEGINIPDADLPDHDPLVMDQLGAVPAYVDPLARRRPAEVWMAPAKPHMRAVVTSLAGLLDEQSVRRLDTHLSHNAGHRAGPRLSLNCALKQEARPGLASWWYADCSRTAVADEPTGDVHVRMRLAVNGQLVTEGEWLQFSMDGRRYNPVLVLGGRIRRVSDAAFMRVANQANGALQADLILTQRRRLRRVRLPDGNSVRVARLTTNSRDARLELIAADDFAGVASAIQRLADARDPVLRQATFAPARFLMALFAELDLAAAPPVPQADWPMAPRLDATEGLQRTASQLNLDRGLALVRHHCGACHGARHTFPPGFLHGGAQAVRSQVRACAPRMLYRLDMWHQTGGSKSPMPPAHALSAVGHSDVSWRQSEELAELVRYLGDLAEGTTVQGAYESLPECVVAQP